MVGIGYTPEGLPDNYLTTDLLFEMGHKNEPVDMNVKFRRTAGILSQRSAAVEQLGTEMKT